MFKSLFVLMVRAHAPDGTSKIGELQREDLHRAEQELRAPGEAQPTATSGWAGKRSRDLAVADSIFEISKACEATARTKKTNGTQGNSMHLFAKDDVARRLGWRADFLRFLAVFGGIDSSLNHFAKHLRAWMAKELAGWWQIFVLQ